MKKALYTATLVLVLVLSSLLAHSRNHIPSAPAKTETTQDMHDESNIAATIYKRNCASCHDRGIMGAPRPGEPRLLKDIDTLVKNTITGIGNMPARGHASFLTDDEVRAVVEYMTSAR